MRQLVQVANERERKKIKGEEKEGIEDPPLVLLVGLLDKIF